MPSLNSVLAATDHVPFAPTVALTVCSTPKLSVIKIATMAPCGAVVVPEIVGVVSFEIVSGVILSAGGVKSITPLPVVLLVKPPSVTLAETVNSPSGRISVASTLQIPPTTVVVTVYETLLTSVMTTVISVLSAALLVPDIAGV